jgi:hypothetical protein
MKNVLRKLGLAYVVIGSLLANIVWFSYMWPATWGAPSHVSFWQQVIGVGVIEPYAVISGGLRLVFWGPSLAVWGFSPQGYPFGKWLAPGFYSEPPPAPANH